jgi:hypothetical protein
MSTELHPQLVTFHFFVKAARLTVVGPFEFARRRFPTKMVGLCAI